MTKNDVLVGLGCLIAASALMFHTFASRPGALSLASTVWSDFGAHLPLIRSFSYGRNFPPEYPTFPGEPIRYHYLFYLLVGLLEKGGVNLGLALNGLSAVGFALLLWAIYRVSRLLFRSCLAGVIAIGLFLLNGSFSFLNYFAKYGWSLSSFLAIPQLTRFVSFGPWDGQTVSAFWTLNIYTNQRHLGLSFGLGLWALYPFLAVLAHRRPPSRRWYLFLAAVMLAMPLLHQVMFVMVWMVAVAVTFLDFRHLKTYFPLVVALAVGSLPGILLAPQPNPRTWAVVVGFLSNARDPWALTRYWLWNLGLYLPLLPFLFGWLKRPGRLFLVALLPLFVVANLFRLSPDMINNHKLINFFMIGVGILTAGFLSWLFHRRFPGPVLGLLLGLALTFSGWIDLFPIINDYRGEIADIPAAPTATWIYRHTPPESVFLTTTYLYNPASLAGRKTFEDYGYFNWSMGYNDGERRQQLPVLFSPTIGAVALCRRLAADHLDYVLFAPGPGELGDLDARDSVIARTWQPAYQSPDGYSVYDRRQNCP